MVRSKPVVSLMLEGGAASTRTGRPSRSNRAASSVTLQPSALAVPCARRSWATPKPWGVWAAQSRLRSGVARMVPSSTSLIVSVTGVAATMPAPSCIARSRAVTQAASRAGSTRQRAPSWISTASASAGKASSPRLTDSCRVSPPRIHSTGRSGRAAATRAPIASASWGWPTTPIQRIAGQARAASRVQASTGRPARGSRSLLRSAPMRRPLPAAAISRCTSSSLLTEESGPSPYNQAEAQFPARPERCVQCF